MSTRINLPYGFRVINVGTIAVFTGKIRVKTDDVLALTKSLHGTSIDVYEGRNGTAIMTFSTTDVNKYHDLIETINDKLYTIMSDRLLRKYKPKVVYAMTL